MNKGYNYIYWSQLYQIEAKQMKSKKKLIYKLHQDMQKNPFKPFQQISMRNVGINECNFNKLRSIKAGQMNVMRSPINMQPQKGSEMFTISMKRNTHKLAESLQKNNVMIQAQLNEQKLQKRVKNNKKQTRKTNLNEKMENSQQAQIIQSYRHKPDTLKLRFIQKIRDDQHQEKITQQQKDSQLDQILAKNHYISHHDSFQAAEDSQIYEIQITHDNVPTQYNYSSQKYAFPILSQHQDQIARLQILNEIQKIKHKPVKKDLPYILKNSNSFRQLEKLNRSKSQIIKIDLWKQKYSKNNQNHKDLIQEMHDENKKVQNQKIRIMLPEIRKIKFQKNYKNINTDESIEKLKMIQKYQKQCKNIEIQDIQKIKRKENFKYKAKQLNQEITIKRQKTQQRNVLKDNQQKIHQLKFRQKQKNKFSLKIEVSKMKKANRKNQQNLILLTQLLTKTDDLTKDKNYTSQIVSVGSDQNRVINKINKGEKKCKQPQKNNEQAIQKVKITSRSITINQSLKNLKQLVPSPNLPKQKNQAQNSQSISVPKQTNKNISVPKQTNSRPPAKIIDQTSQKLLDEIIQSTPMSWQNSKHFQQQENELGYFMRYKFQD